MSIFEQFKGTELEGYRIDDWTPSEIWDEYERRKKILRSTYPTSEEYEKEIGKITKELGIN